MGMKKVVINTCYGGFGLSKKCLERLAELRDSNALVELKELDSSTCAFEDYGYAYRYNVDKARENPLLIQAIEEIGLEEASGACADLKIIEIPDDVEYTIEEYDGDEHVAEVHRTWS